jgi:hypothetical protein
VDPTRTLGPQVEPAANVDAASGTNTARRRGKWNQHGTSTRQMDNTAVGTAGETNTRVEAAVAACRGGKWTHTERGGRRWNRHRVSSRQLGPRHVERGKCKEHGTLTRQVTSMCSSTRELREVI